MRIPTIAEITALYSAHQWPIATDRRNILVLRKKPGSVDAFDDMLLTFKGADLFACRCTADPGKPSLESPKRKDGTAVWAPGFQGSALGFGLHHGDYECLAPVKPIVVLRYTSLADTTGTPSTSSSTQIHRASATHESTVVGPWSEGCIVIASPEGYTRHMTLMHAGGGTAFSVALVAWDGKGPLA